jgi:SAM-dependent methyltransferase
MPSGDDPLYTNEFFGWHEAGTLSAADVVVPLLLQLFPVRSVVDFGCARGVWLDAFRRRGVQEICGIDGDYVDREKLLIPREAFLFRDLTGRIALDRTFDMALCLEVAEHLPSSSAQSLIQNLTRSAPLILFSAAIPGQSGVSHINEQWPKYWRNLFEKSGFRLFDPVRPFIYGQRAIPYWYRQNLLLYASGEAVEKYNVLSSAGSQVSEPVCEWVHLSNWMGNETIRGSLKLLRGALKRRIAKRTSKRRRVTSNAES